ncbi:MAG TPA: hypothetical protein PLX77_03050 [Candidatus Cloacimonadota bacterium]|nr:hypothetical protein [Candidatus Cloacimonadota bacterium]
MKKAIFSLLLLGMLLAFTACSENDNGTDPKIYGYILEQFVGKEAVNLITDPEPEEGDDFRGLYNYEIVASDGFSPRNSSNAGWDLKWDVLKTGYIVPDDNRRTWFDNADIPGAFRVKDATKINLYRKVEIADTTGVGVYFELGGMTTHQIENWNGEQEPAIKLADLIAHFTDITGVTLLAADGQTMDYTLEQIQDGYYLLESEKTTFPSFNDEMNGLQKKFKKLATIRVNGTAGTVTYLNANTPDLEITLPEGFAGYTATELIDY